jgi:hypothetical protein
MAVAGLFRSSSRSWWFSNPQAVIIRDCIIRLLPEAKTTFIGVKNASCDFEVHLPVLREKLVKIGIR